MKYYLFFVCLLSALLANAQKTNFSGTVQADGLYASEQLPFWFYTNSNTLKGGLTNAAGYAYAKMDYDLSESSIIEVGAGLMYRDGFEDRFARNELYARFTNKWIKATVGSKNPNEIYDGLSTSNGNILWSGNNRAIPGITIEAPKPLKIWKNLHLDYGLGHYVLNDNRFVDNTRIHYKKLGFSVALNDKHNFKGTLQHYAQWGGTHPILGKLPSGFSDYIKVVLAQNAGDNAEFNEQVNALGNHLGSYDLEYTYTGDKGTFKGYHLHLFEDGSGTAFKNFPDGIWGLTYAPKDKIFTRLLYEYVHTVDQSSGSGRSAGDNYFSNKGYRSGWTYEGTTIGLPFILLNPETGLGISNNRIKAHHFGALFTFQKFDITLKLSAVNDAGSPSNPLTSAINSIYSYGKGVYHTDFGDFLLQGGLDTSSIADTTFGVGLGYQYSF